MRDSFIISTMKPIAMSLYERVGPFTYDMYVEATKDAGKKWCVPRMKEIRSIMRKSGFVAVGRRRENGRTLTLYAPRKKK